MIENNVCLLGEKAPCLLYKSIMGVFLEYIMNLPTFKDKNLVSIDTDKKFFRYPKEDGWGKDSCSNSHSKILPILGLGQNKDLIKKYEKDIPHVEISQINTLFGSIKQDDSSLSNGLFLDSTEDSPWMGYTKKAIDTILPLRLEVLSDNVDYVIPEYILNDSDMSASLISQEICQTVFKKSEGVTSAILNLNGKHWISLVVGQDLNGIKVYYMDSEQQPVPLIFKQQLVKDLKEISSSEVEFIEHDVAKQKYNNCGPESIENIMRLLSDQQFIDQDDVLEVHSSLYETKLYEDFNQTNEHLLLE